MGSTNSLKFSENIFLKLLFLNHLKLNSFKFIFLTLFWLFIFFFFQRPRMIKIWLVSHILTSTKEVHGPLFVEAVISPLLPLNFPDLDATFSLSVMTALGIRSTAPFNRSLLHVINRECTASLSPLHTCISALPFVCH